MSGFRPFVRQLGSQPGVQLNPLQDQTDGSSPDNSDQIIAILARLTRGRIDAPFRVNQTNFLAKTGPGESIGVNALNEAKLQLYEALSNGASEAVVMRMAPAAAVKSYAVINFSGTPTGSSDTVAFTTATTPPTTGFSIYLMHHACHNDGIKVELHADGPLTGSPAPATDVTLRVLDSTGTAMYEFTGSLSAAAKDDFGKSRYLPDVVAMRTNDVDVVVAAGAQIPITSNAYGRSLSGKDNWATSATLSCFSEGGTSYDTADYDRFIAGLRNTNNPFGYLITGGTQNTTLISKLAALAIDINVPLEVDIPGTLSPTAAVAFEVAQNIDSHLVRFYWAPLLAEDPLNGGRAVWGYGGLHAGMSCARNARLNAKGFAPKNYPVAGKDWPLNRVGIVELSRPTDQERSDLARAQINPVIYQAFNGGGRTVNTDSLTAAKTVVSYRKLQSVAEMATSLDNWITLYSNELLQLPMQEFVKRMSAFLDVLLADAQASGWLVPAKNLPGNAAYAFTVAASEVRPADLVLINYYTSYDGVARQVIVQQTLVK